MHPQPNTVPMGLMQPKPAVAQRPLPRHIGLMACGLARWSSKLGVTYGVGTATAVQRFLELTDFCVQRHIEALTLYVFPSDVGNLDGEAGQNTLSLFLRHLEAVARTLHSWRIRLRVVGETSLLPDALTQLILDTENKTQHNQGLDLTISLNGAQLGDVGKAFKAWQQNHEQTRSGNLLARALKPLELPLTGLEPDFVIRTGSGLPLGHPLIWETSKTSLYYTTALWPDFDTRCLARALHWFSQEDRPVGTQVITS